ncbi:MAG: T9SS type A sorting domain-containing protein [Ignavibacteria bacterium]|nr:T9SS type A sorting domain-containing protein [Ignavibacteria bacterium]
MPKLFLVFGISFSLLVFPHLLISQIQNVRVSSPSSTSPEEVSIAINPTNPDNLIAGANIRFTYYSTNAGQSWTQGQLPQGTWGDPCVLFDVNGRAYYAHLSNPSGGYFIERLIIHRSTNGGIRWHDSVDIGYNPPKQQDKEWLAVDNTNSPFRNSLYMTWTEFDDYGSSNPLDSSRILFARSLDSGTTWTTPKKICDKSGDCIDSDNTVEGAVPAVGPNGEIYTSWSGPLGIMFDKSADGGNTWGTDVFVATQPGGWDFDVPGIYRANGLPITACDVSNSPYRGNIYVAWSDQRNGANNTDIFVIKSTNGGNTWGAIKKVNDDITASQQFFVWMTIDQTTGNVYFVFYDRRNTTGNATDVYVAQSSDGGETFVNFKVSQSSFVPNSSVFFGDYICIAAHNRKIYPLWTRMDNSNLSVWTAIITDTTNVGVNDESQLPSDFILSQNFPNPFNPQTTIPFALNNDGFVSLKIFDILGREVASLVNAHIQAGTYNITWNATNVSSGIYLCRLQSKEFSTYKKMFLHK